jgi:SpoVK/Ycf46/Vps4 family AAA+-type ATPase
MDNDYFYQRIVLMCLGSAMTYYCSLQLLEHMNTHDMHIDHVAKSHLDIFMKRTIDLSAHELSVLNDVILPCDIQVSLKDIYGLKNEKKLIKKSLFGHKDIIFKNTENTKGILLHGPPGTGKTMLAQAIAKYANMPIICFNIANIENKLFGESNKMISALFSLSEKIQPCVIFIDEIDCFGSSRNPLDQSHVNNMKSMMLTQMDGVSKTTNKTIFIGATNRPDSIDPALRRRIPIGVEISLPDLHSISHLLNQLIDISTDDIHTIASMCVGLSCSDIRQLCNTVSTVYTPHMNIIECFRNNMRLLDV